MSRNKLLALRLNEVLLNGTWIANTNFKLQIESLSWKEATFKPENLNSIAMLIFHIDYYLAGILQVFDGGTLDIRDKYSFDMPEINSEETWNVLKNQFLSHAGAFVEFVENMPESLLHKPFVDEKYGTYERNIEGVIEHSYYHLGQISLIKKMIRLQF